MRSMTDDNSPMIHILYSPSEKSILARTTEYFKDGPENYMFTIYLDIIMNLI